MTLKQKYNGIDQSKLPKSIVKVLKGIEKKTNGFEDSKANRAFESKIDTIRKGLEKKYPEALDKSLPKNESKAKSAKKSILSFIENDPILKGIRGTDIIRDKDRKAKASGKRISKSGNVYYEYRENRTDRYAPEFPKNKPFLEKGGSLDEITEAIFYGNARGGRMETSFGEKTRTGVMEMIRNVEYGAQEIAKAFFGSKGKTDRINTGWGSKSLQGLTEMIEKARKNIVPKKLEEGGLVYIDFYNAKKNFTKDRKHFNSFEDAEEWGLNNFKSFNPDMINFLSNKNVASRPVYTDLEIDLDDISESTINDLKVFLKSINQDVKQTSESLLINVRHPNNDKSKVVKIKNWLYDRSVAYDLPLPFEAGGFVRGYSDLGLAEQNEIDERLENNMSFYFDLIGLDMPEVLSGDEYEEAMDVARDEMARQGLFKGEEEITGNVEPEKIYLIGKGAKVKYPDATMVATVVSIKPSVVPNDFEIEALYDDGKKITDDLSSLEIVEQSNFEEGGELNGRYVPMHLKDFIFEQNSDEIEYNGWGIFDTEREAFTNISTDRERVPYQPAGGFTTAQEIAEMQNNGHIKPEDIYIVRHKRHKFDSKYENGGEVSDNEYVEYLNEIGEGYDFESPEWIIGGEERLEFYPSSYGVALKKFDPIGFNVGKREFEQQNYSKGGELIEVYNGSRIENTNGVIEVVNGDSRYIVDLDDSKTSGKRTSTGASIEEQIKMAKDYIDWRKSVMENGGVTNQALKHTMKFDF